MVKEEKKMRENNDLELCNFNDVVSSGSSLWECVDSICYARQSGPF